VAMDGRFGGCNQFLGHGWSWSCDVEMLSASMFMCSVYLLATA
jgi:hypothetical protein